MFEVTKQYRHRLKFLGIGAQKAGTTWLAEQLQLHRQIYIPYIKEMRFWDSQSVPFPYIFLPVLGSMSERRQSLMLIYWLLKDINNTKRYWAWFLRYFFIPRTENWYANMVNSSHDCIGEISPDYALLNLEQIYKIYNYNPNVKVIYLLRDPLDRMWSQAEMYFNLKYNWSETRFNAIQRDEIRKFFSKTRIQHSLYHTNIERWRCVFPAAQIFIGFFEEIRDNPRKLLLEIQEFLEVDSVITGDLEKVSLPKTTARRNKLLFNNDPELNHILKTSLKEDTISLSREFNNQYTQQWLVKLLDTD